MVVASLAEKERVLVELMPFIAKPEMLGGVVSSVIALAHGLDLDVVAEGVETPEQRKLLGLLRCDQMQGYLYSPAVNKHGITDLMLAESSAATHKNPVLRAEGEAGLGLPERRRPRSRR